MRQLKIHGEKKKRNSENALQEILQQMFELTARTLITGLRAFHGIIDDALQHQKQNSVNFMPYKWCGMRKPTLGQILHFFIFSAHLGNETLFPMSLIPDHKS